MAHVKLVYPSKDEVMDLLQKRNGFFTVLGIATSLVTPFVPRSNPMDEEIEHIRASLHELKSKDFLLVESEGKDILTEKFSTTPDRAARYFSKDKIQDFSNLTTRTDEELQDIIRQNNNPHVPGSLHNRALLELDIRHKNKVEKLLGIQDKKQGRGKTKRSEYKTDKLFVQSRTQGDDDEHILIGKRDGTPEKAHLIVDAENASIRIEDGRLEPTDLVKGIETIITLEDGKRIRSTREGLTEAAPTERVSIELEAVSINPSVTTKEGLLESFSMNIPFLIKNFSKHKVALRNIKMTVDVPEGYDHSQSFTDLSGTRIINGEEFVLGSCTFSVSVRGRNNGLNPKNVEWEENKNKLIKGIGESSVVFHVRAEAVYLSENILIEKSFDLSSEVLPRLMKSQIL